MKKNKEKKSIGKKKSLRRKDGNSKYLRTLGGSGSHLRRNNTKMSQAESVKFTSPAVTAVDFVESIVVKEVWKLSASQAKVLQSNYVTPQHVIAALEGVNWKKLIKRLRHRFPTTQTGFVSAVNLAEPNEI